MLFTNGPQQIWTFGVLFKLAVFTSRRGLIANLQMDLLVRWSQCAVDGLILAFCVYPQRHAHLAQLSQLSLGGRLIQSWRRLTGDCILSNSSTTNSIILLVLFSVSPSLPLVRSSSSLLRVLKYSRDIHGGVLKILCQTLKSLKCFSLLTFFFSNFLPSFCLIKPSLLSIECE